MKKVPVLLLISFMVSSIYLIVMAFSSEVEVTRPSKTQSKFDVAEYRNELRRSGKNYTDSEFLEHLMLKGIRPSQEYLSSLVKGEKNNTQFISAASQISLENEDSGFSIEEIERYEQEISRILKLNEDAKIESVEEIGIVEPVYLTAMKVDQRKRLHLHVSESFKQLANDEDNISKFHSLFMGIKNNELIGLSIHLPNETLGSYLRKKDRREIHNAQQALESSR